MSEPKYLTQKESAEVLRCSVRTLYRMRKQGEIAYRKVRGQYLYNRADVYGEHTARRYGRRMDKTSDSTS